MSLSRVTASTAGGSLSPDSPPACRRAGVLSGEGPLGAGRRKPPMPTGAQWMRRHRTCRSETGSVLLLVHDARGDL
jgi:hypothetical protein